MGGFRGEPGADRLEFGEIAPSEGPAEIWELGCEPIGHNTAGESGRAKYDDFITTFGHGHLYPQTGGNAMGDLSGCPSVQALTRPCSSGTR